MRKQSTVLASLFLSLVAGMLASEAVSYHFDHSAAAKPRLRTQQSAPEVAGMAWHSDAVN